MSDFRIGRRDALPPGSKLRDYTVGQVLGHGGFGIVYQACHDELGHTVAIKEYIPSEVALREGAIVRARSIDCADVFADGLRRFREEAKALIDFRHHPNIIDYRHFFRLNGTAYLVMEYVEGLPLSELLRRREAAGRPFTQTDLLSIAVPLARGLEHIHRAGVLHRDIKPANILVRQSDQQPVLIDFGAAKQAVAEHSRSLAPYTEGYAALEQVANGQLGPWTDLYGYGAVLWRIVAGGNPPWEPPNPVKVERRANARLQDAVDPLPSAKELGAGRFSEQLLSTIDACLPLTTSERLSESDQVVQLLEAKGQGHGKPAAAAPPAKHLDRAECPPMASPRHKGYGTWKTHRRWLIPAVVAISVAAALTTLALMPRTNTLEPSKSWSFEVQPVPAKATVALLNHSEAYRLGMSLASGRYEVEVSAPGYETRREWILHGESPTQHRVELAPLAAEEPSVPQVPMDTPSRGIDRESPRAGQTRSEDSSLIEPTAVDDVGASTRGQTQPRIGFEPPPVEEPEPPEASLGAHPEPKQSTPEEKEQALGNDSETTEPTPDSTAERVSQVGSGAEERPQLSLEETYQRACDSGIAADCHNLGLLYHNGEGVVRNTARAAQLYARACDRGVAAACNNLGLLYHGGNGVGRNSTRAGQLFGQACDSGFALGCHNLGLLHDNGDGMTRDRRRAAELYQWACDGNEMRGCVALAICYYRGRGTRRDKGIAAALFQKACRNGSEVGCEMLATLDW